MQPAHRVADQDGGFAEGVDSRGEFVDESLGADRSRIIDITATMPGGVIGVDRAQLRQPRQLARPRTAAAHQPVYQHDRAAGTAAVEHPLRDHQHILRDLHAAPCAR